MTHDYRVLLFGGSGGFSQRVLERLVASEISIAAVALFGYGPIHVARSSPIPVAEPRCEHEILSVVDRHTLPVVYLEELQSSQTLERLSAYSPDFILCACFPRVLPEALYRLPSVACLNLHPSMLPAYRGPTPLFWQLRNGESNTGVTLHLVTDVIDGGEIVLQRQYSLADGLSHQEINRQLADLGAELFVQCLEMYAAGCAKSVAQKKGSYFPLPKAGDFSLSTEWPARRAFNFIRGTSHKGVAYNLSTAGQTFTISMAKDYQDSGALDHEWKRSGDSLSIQFTPGILHAVGELVR